MGEDRELRVIVLGLIRAMVQLQAAVAESAPPDPRVQSLLGDAQAALDEAVGRFEKVATHERV